MGLLSRAKGKTSPETPSPAAEDEFSLDEMGESLKERIGRLPSTENTPYTSLSLLKAYGAFQSGYCLNLKNGIYTSYTSIGAGTQKISLSGKKVWSKENTLLRYFPFDLAANIEEEYSVRESNYWVFPLGSSENIMILEAEESAEKNSKEHSSFDPKAISAIIAGVSDKFIRQTEQDDMQAPPPDEPATEEIASDAALDDAFVEELIPEDDLLDDSTSDEPAALEALTPEKGHTLEREIIKFQQTHNEVNCIIFDTPAGEDGAVFLDKVSKMINTLGSVIPISPERLLILLPSTVDWELLSHRLSKKLNTTPLISFEAESPQNILNRVKSLM